LKDPFSKGDLGKVLNELSFKSPRPPSVKQREEAKRGITGDPIVSIPEQGFLVYPRNGDGEPEYLSIKGCNRCYRSIEGLGPVAITENLAVLDGRKGRRLPEIGSDHGND
jgi:hypothetical protein